MIDIIPGVKITNRLDRPEIFMAVNSSDFFIFKKNQMPDKRIMNGKKLCNKLGVNNIDKINGTLIDTSVSLKKFISSNKLIEMLQYSHANKLKGYGWGISIETINKIRFDICVGLNHFGSRTIHFINYINN